MLRSLFICIVAVAAAEVTHDGACPDMTPVAKFNLTAYQGIWYEISKFYIESEKDGKCAQAEYTLDGDVVKVKNTHVVDGVQTFIEGVAKFAPDANESAKFVVTFKFGDVARDSPLLILATDYTSYSIAYNYNAWILSRSKTLEGPAKEAVDAFLKSKAKEIDATKLLQTDFSEEACKFNGTTLITEPVKQ